MADQPESIAESMAAEIFAPSQDALPVINFGGIIMLLEALFAAIQQCRDNKPNRIAKQMARPGLFQRIRFASEIRRRLPRSLPWRVRYRESWALTNRAAVVAGQDLDRTEKAVIELLAEEPVEP